METPFPDRPDGIGHDGNFVDRRAFGLAGPSFFGRRTHLVAISVSLPTDAFPYAWSRTRRPFRLLAAPNSSKLAEPFASCASCTSQGDLTSLIDLQSDQARNGMGAPPRASRRSDFLNVGRLLADIGWFAELCGVVSVLNSQTPRLARRIF
jgi:hypothetical protein